METPENLNNQEFNKKSPDQLANQKFDEIYKKLLGDKKMLENYSYDFGKNQLNIQKDGNIKGTIYCNQTTNDGGKENIVIVWGNTLDNDSSVYRLSRTIDGKFKLYVKGGGREQEIDNLTPEELLNNILPNFEKRLNEGEIIKKQERSKAIEEANQFAFQQDQQDADKLLQENGLV